MGKKPDRRVRFPGAENPVFTLFLHLPPFSLLSNGKRNYMINTEEGKSMIQTAFIALLAGVFGYLFFAVFNPEKF